MTMKRKNDCTYIIRCELRGAERAWAVGELVGFLSDWQTRQEADAWLDGRRVLRYDPDTGRLICMPIQEL